MNTSKSLTLNELLTIKLAQAYLHQKSVGEMVDSVETAIVEAVEGIYGDSDGLREFASTGSNQVDTSVECPLSQRVDGKTHSWKFDGDDPYILCVYCGELRDALTGNVITKGRTK